MIGLMNKKELYIVSMLALDFHVSCFAKEPTTVLLYIARVFNVDQNLRNRLESV